MSERLSRDLKTSYDKVGESERFKWEVEILGLTKTKRLPCLSQTSSIFLSEEREETLKEERLERNQRWRERRSGGLERISSEETEAVSEGEERRLKNREWRQRREERRRREEAGVVSEDYCHLSPPRLEHQILRELLCGLCQEELGPPGQIYQCEEGHNLCGDCRARPDLKGCPQCFSQFSGRNFALERLAATLFSHSGLGKEGGVQEYVSRSFVFATSQDVINEGRRDTSEDISDIESILLDTEGETLRIK